MRMLFRDHFLSDLIGFTYQRAAAADAAEHFLAQIRNNTGGRESLVPIILDGENAWEYYPKSGREFLRRFYAGLQNEPRIEAVTVSEAIARHREFSPLTSLVPGSWIDANFNVWIGAPEDNRSWDYLHRARDFYTQNSGRANEQQRKLALEEILIAEGSDWNWWYGPEHHSANDREFDQLYRKHLSNVYQALGASPPDYLAQPILGGISRPFFTPQTAYIHPRVTGDMVRYFEWMGAAVYTSDGRSGSMHGKTFLLDSVYAGIDADNLYGRLDFAGKGPEPEFDLLVNAESWAAEAQRPRRALRLDVSVEGAKVRSWKVCAAEDAKVLAASAQPPNEVKVVLFRNFEFKLPLAWLLAKPPSAVSATAKISTPIVTRIRLRFSLWQNRLPVDALPVEGWIELPLLSEEDLLSLA
jgi:hypothetical protein